jgi:hypothetical protein
MMREDYIRYVISGCTDIPDSRGCYLYDNYSFVACEDCILKETWSETE